MILGVMIRVFALNDYDFRQLKQQFSANYDVCNVARMQVMQRFQKKFIAKNVLKKCLSCLLDGENLVINVRCLY